MGNDAVSMVMVMVKSSHSSLILSSSIVNIKESVVSPSAKEIAVEVNE